MRRTPPAGCPVHIAEILRAFGGKCGGIREFCGSFFRIPGHCWGALRHKGAKAHLLSKICVAAMTVCCAFMLKTMAYLLPLCVIYRDLEKYFVVFSHSLGEMCYFCRW